MPEETEQPLVPYEVPPFGEVIFAVELFARRVHSAQRLALLDKLQVPERVAMLMRDVNRSLSSPDEERDRAYGRRANELLRNAAVKGHLASFLAVEGLIERLASLTRSQGFIDTTLSNKAIIDQLDWNQLIALQRSQHTQTLELLQFLEKKKYDGLSAVTSMLTQQAEAEIATGMAELSKLKPGSRDVAGELLNKLIAAIATKRTVERAVAAEITDTQ
jgi:hypothetical protein